MAVKPGIVTRVLDGIVGSLAIAGMAMITCFADLIPRRARPGHLTLDGSIRSARVVVPTWNGQALLERNLPAILKSCESAEAAGYQVSVVIVDDGSVDGTAEWLRQMYGRLTMISLPRNEGFSSAINHGTRNANEDALILLNNDMSPRPDCILKLLVALEEPGIFATTAAIEMPGRERQEETGMTAASWRFGRIAMRHDPAVGEHEPLYAGGGSSAFRNSAWRELGGFDPLFSPCYFEDADISIRARRLRAQIRLVSDARVRHQHRASTTRRYEERELETNRQANEILFHLRHLSRKELGAFAVRSSGRCFLGDNSGVEGVYTLGAILRACARAPALLRSRLRSPVLPIADLLLKGRTRHSRGAGFPDTPEVLVLAPYSPVPAVHGGAMRMENMLAELHRRGARVTLLAMADTDEEKSEESMSRLERHCAGVRIVPRLPNPAARYLPHFFREFEVSEFNRALAEIMEARSFDVIQVEYAELARFLPARSACITSVTLHEIPSLSRLMLSRTRGSMLRQLPGIVAAWLYESVVLRRFDLIVTMTQSDRDHLSARFGTRPISIPTGVNLDRYPFAGDSERTPELFLFAGAFRHSPNMDAARRLLDRIWPLLSSRYPAARLLFVGSDPFGSLARLLSDRDREIDRVAMTGSVADFSPYLRKAFAFLCPMSGAGGIRTRLLEVMASGLPVIATENGALGLGLEDGRHYLKAEDDESFATAVAKLRVDSKLWTRLSIEGRRHIEENFSSAVMGERLWSAYQGEWRRFRLRIGRPIPDSGSAGIRTSFH